MTATLDLLGITRNVVIVSWCSLPRVEVKFRKEKHGSSLPSLPGQMKASFALIAKTNLTPYLLRNIPAHHLLCAVDCVCRLFRDWIMVLGQDPFIQHKLCLHALDCELSSNCSSMVLVKVLTLTFAFTNVWLKEYECPQFKMEPKCLLFFCRHSHF